MNYHKLFSKTNLCGQPKTKINNHYRFSPRNLCSNNKTFKIIICNNLHKAIRPLNNFHIIMIKILKNIISFFQVKLILKPKIQRKTQLVFFQQTNIFKKIK